MYYSLQINQLPCVNDFYEVTRNTVWKIADKYHILIMIEEGECEITCGADNYHLHAGECAFIPSGQFYSRHPVNNEMCTMYYIHFSTDSEIISEDSISFRDSIYQTKQRMDSDISRGILLPDIDRIYLSSKIGGLGLDQIQNFTERMNNCFAERHLMFSMELRNILCDLLICLSRLTVDEVQVSMTLQEETAIPAKLKQAVSYIINHTYKSISLEELSDYCGVSKQQMIRYFKNAFHTTPNAYITNYRLFKAKDFLCNSPSLSIKEIASELGFSSQYYFTAVFKKTFQESPSEYRHRVTHSAEIQNEDQYTGSKL